MTREVAPMVPDRLDTMREPSSADLEQVLAMRIGCGRSIRTIARRPSASRSSFFVDEIDVTLDDGTPVGLIAKATHCDAMSPEARGAKPPFLWDQARERVTYESILQGLELNTPSYLGSYVDGSGVQYLLLERVDGVPLWQYGEFEAWREAARWLARLHTRVDVAAAATGGAGAHLLRYDRPYYERWMRRACAFDQAASRDIAALAERHSQIVEWLLAEPTAFIHGEFYAGNIVVDGADGRSTFVTRPVDWEMAALGPALVDLACLLAGRWTDEERADAADVYFAECAASGGHVPERMHYLKTLDCCLIHLSARNLGWSRDWSPPPDRAHDWLQEALRLCDKWRL